jgi:hypothetical protein
MKTWVLSAASLALLHLVYACSSAPPPAPEYPELLEAQAQAKAAAESSKKPSSDSKSVAKAPSQPAPAAEPSAAGDGLRKASRPPVELLTNSNASFILNFPESEPGKTAKEECEATGGDKGEVSACLQKARAKIPIESLRFVKKGNEYWWITLNRYKGNLMKWHIIQFQVGEEKADWVALRPIGKDKGIAPMARIPRALEIELPNDFSIVMKDPEFGKLIFDAKIGVFDD